MTPAKGLMLGDRYELESRIAVGGMGEVWIALDRHLRRKVAAKVLRAEFAGEKTFLDRLRTEARNSAALSHQNIAAMYDYGEQSGSGYLIMELVHGEPLAELLARERTLEPAQLLPVLAQTARALHTAHMAGVVHRDVKPSNILLTPDGYVKITDFGISLGSNQAPMTAAGMVMGTAQYLPPEQAMGRAATGAGDIYALGVVAYEALVGKRPFTGGSQVDIAFAHVNQQVPPLPEHLDPRVRAIVMQMLEKDPEQRPRSAASLARSLEALAGHLDVAIEPQTEPVATAVDGSPTPVGGLQVPAPAGGGQPHDGGTTDGGTTDGGTSHGGTPGARGARDPVDSDGRRAPGAQPDPGAGAGGSETPARRTTITWRPLTEGAAREPATPPPAPVTRRARREVTGRPPGVHRRRVAHGTVGFAAWLRAGWWWAVGIVLAAALLTVFVLWLSRLGAAPSASMLAAPALTAARRRPTPTRE